MSELEDVATALRTATARLQRRLRAEAGHSEYTASQVAVARRLLEHGPATTSELARAEGVRPQSMSATIAVLEAAGVVARRPDPGDRRATQVFVAEQAMREVRAAKQGWLTRTMAERLTAAERRTLADASALIERMLQP